MDQRERGHEVRVGVLHREVALVRLHRGLEYISWDLEELFVRSTAKTGETFVLKVRGESMIEKGIFDGDIVFVKPQQTAENGQTVVALVDGEATVKTFRRSRSAIHLEPANPEMEPIVVILPSDSMIRGLNALVIL